ncbi:hypothetical protein C8F01DRAFT_1095209 [Mycena amicta]|nr:hypothetical protein C8F01DRAFT_1095209 [Mycena amicta]
MKAVGRKKKVLISQDTSRVATNVPSVKVTFHSVPAYETTPACDETGKEKAAETQQTVAHMNDLKTHEGAFLRMLLGLHHHPQLLTPCSCPDVDGVSKRRKVACSDCLQPELLCRQCWLDKHRTTPSHWALVWNTKQHFFEKTDFSRVMKNGAIRLGHYGEGCPNSDRARRFFTLVDQNGIHATAIEFCGCKNTLTFSAEPHAQPHFEQLLQARIFPGSVKDPKTGYTLGLLDFHRQERNQGKGSAYNFALVLKRMADPFFAGEVPDIYKNFLAISRFYEHLQITMEAGAAHGLGIAIPGELGLPYPNRPTEFLGVICAACPEPGVNMPLVVNVPKYLRHTISKHLTLDGNFKANLFYKRDNGSDVALTDGRMYFPKQEEYDIISKRYIVAAEDTEVPCKSHISSIRHQGQPKYGNTAISGVVACACDHAVLGSLIDMPKGEAFGHGTYAQRELLRHTNTPPLPPESQTPHAQSYDGYCSYVVKQLKRAIVMFPDETWLHDLLRTVEGQIPADHINGHGHACKTIWQAVYFACRAHFHGETAEMIWAFLNPLGPSTRQMTAGSRHDVINFVMHSWNVSKYLRQAHLVAAERLDALRLFELHMAVLEDLSRQHPDDVGAWSRMSRLATKGGDGKFRSVYQHDSSNMLTIESTLASMIAAEQERLKPDGEREVTTSLAQWLHDGMAIERQQALTIALLKNHRDHPLQETWDSLSKLRDSLNLALEPFRDRQRELFPHLTLSAMDVDEPEVTAIQLPSYRMKHGWRPNADEEEVRQAEIQLRRTEAEAGIFAVREASLALSAVKKAREQDYRGQVGITRSQRNLQKAEMLKMLEIDRFNNSRVSLVNLGYMGKDDTEPFRPLTLRDTRRKETHLHRATGDSRVFDGTAWYLQSGTTISRSAVPSTLLPEADTDSEQPQLLAGTLTLKRSSFKHGQRSPKRLKDIVPDDVQVESSESEADGVAMSPTKKGQTKKAKTKKGNKPDGWIWFEDLVRRQPLSKEKQMAYKKESERVQFFRAEAEMYRRLEQYERNHAELRRVIERYSRESQVWTGFAEREQTVNGRNGVAAYARMQAAMHQRLQHNVQVIFEDPASGAHHDWVSATSFEEMVVKMDGWRDVVFKWMDDMGIHRAYKDF